MAFGKLGAGHGRLGLVGGSRLVLWTPLSDTSLDAWWNPQDSSKFTLNSGNIAAWADSKTALVASQATAGNQPAYSATGLNSLPAYVGSASKYLSAASLSAAQIPFTCFAVLNPAASLGAIFGSAAASALEFRVDAGGTFSLLKQSVGLIGTSTNASISGTNAIILVTYDAAGNYAFRVNGTAAGSGVSLQTFSANSTVIGSNAGSAEFFVGAMGDLAKRSAVASLSLSQKYEGYGAWHYGIASVLPGGHPYKLRPPYVSDP